MTCRLPEAVPCAPAIPAACCPASPLPSLPAPCLAYPLQAAWRTTRRSGGGRLRRGCPRAGRWRLMRRRSRTTGTGGPRRRCGRSQQRIRPSTEPLLPGGGPCCPLRSLQLPLCAGCITSCAAGGKHAIPVPCSSTSPLLLHLVPALPFRPPLPAPLLPGALGPAPGVHHPVTTCCTSLPVESGLYLLRDSARPSTAGCAHTPGATHCRKHAQ